MWANIPVPWECLDSFCSHRCPSSAISAAKAASRFIHRLPQHFGIQLTAHRAGKGRTRGLDVHPEGSALTRRMARPSMGLAYEVATLGWLTWGQCRHLFLPFVGTLIVWALVESSMKTQQTSKLIAILQTKSDGLQPNSNIGHFEGSRYTQVFPETHESPRITTTSPMYGVFGE